MQDRKTLKKGGGEGCQAANLRDYYYYYTYTSSWKTLTYHNTFQELNTSRADQGSENSELREKLTEKDQQIVALNQTLLQHQNEIDTMKNNQAGKLYIQIYNVPLKFASKLIHGGPLHFCHRLL